MAYLKLLKIGAPFLIIIGMWLWHNRAVNNAFEDGATSRDVEVQTLTTERNTALTNVETLKGDLGRCQTNKLTVEREVTSLNSKLVAQAEENKKALRLQAESFASTQAVTSRAMETLARNTQAADIDFAGILEQLKGVEYGYDKDTDSCIIRGGGRILRNAAKGKVGG